MAHRRRDVHAINQAIRATRKISGLGSEGTLFQTDHGPHAFAEGDRILFTRNDATLGVRNGMLATVEKISNAKLTIRMDAVGGNTGWQLTSKPREFLSVDHGFAASNHRSQGCTVDKSFVLSCRTMDKNLTYVALTRHRQEAKLYTAPEIAPQRERMEHYPKFYMKSNPLAPTRSQ